MKVRDVMSDDVKLATPDMSLEQAAKLMEDADAGILPVGENDRLVGMLTDRDIVIRAVAKGLDVKRTLVREAMSPEVKYCYEDEDLNHVSQNMADLQVRRLPVVNREKRLVGIISVGDIAASDKPIKAGAALRGIAQPSGQHNQGAAYAASKPLRNH
jgi:CBS domain-containing protein